MATVSAPASAATCFARSPSTSVSSDRVHLGDRPQRGRVGLTHSADPDHPDAHPGPAGSWTSVRTASPRLTLERSKPAPGGREWNVPTNGAYDRRRRRRACQTDRDGRSAHGHDPPHHRRRHRPVPDRAADRDRRERGAPVPGRVRDLRPRQRHLPGRGPRGRAGPAPDVARSPRGIDGDGGRRVREGEASAPDHGRHELDRPGGAEHGDGGRHRAREPAPRPPALRRHVREPRARPGAPAGGAVRRPERHGERRVPAGDPVLGPDRAPGAAAPVAPPGRRDDARSRGLRAGLPRIAAGRPGGGVRLPRLVLRASGASDPPAGTRSGGAGRSGARCSGRRSVHS